MPVQGDSPVRQPVIDGDSVLIFSGELWEHDDVSDTNYLFKTLNEARDLIATISNLRGMFAFVYKNKDTIHFASDVFGEEPLYFVWYDRNLSVASEIKHLVAIGLSPQQIQPARPGILYTMRGGELTSDTYHAWAFTNDRLEFEPVHLRKLVRKSVEEHYASNNLQRCAVLLSGGLDSTIIAYELAQLGVKDAFTIGLDPDCVDLVTARRTASQLDLRHHEVLLSEKNTDCAIAITELSNRSIVEAACCHIALSNVLNEHDIRVVFSGSGADEVFVGYQHLLRFCRKSERGRLQRYFVERYHAFDLRALNKIYMLNAVEVRNPFLSVDLMNYAATLDVDELLVGRKRQMKLALRQAYAPLIGEIANNPKLIAFETMGIKDYFRGGSGSSPFVYRKRFKEIFSNCNELIQLVDCAKTIR